MNYNLFTDKDIKFWILKVLSLDSDFTVNTNILQIALKEFGHDLSINSLEQHLNILEDVKLVTLEFLEHLTIAKITRSGLDTVQGRQKSNIVRRPNPEEL